MGGGGVPWLLITLVCQPSGCICSTILNHEGEAMFVHVPFCCVWIFDMGLGFGRVSGGGFQAP